MYNISAKTDDEDDKGERRANQRVMMRIMIWRIKKDVKDDDSEDDKDDREVNQSVFNPEDPTKPLVELHPPDHMVSCEYNPK